MKRDNSDKNLENPENWDFEKAELREGVKSHRVVVSVSFRNDDFKIVYKFAEHLGQKTSEFIREAALEKASGKTLPAMIYGSGNTGILWSTAYLPSTTKVQTLELEKETAQAAFTSSFG